MVTLIKVDSHAICTCMLSPCLCNHVTNCSCNSHFYHAIIHTYWNKSLIIKMQLQLQVYYWMHCVHYTLGNGCL